MLTGMHRDDAAQRHNACLEVHSPQGSFDRVPYHVGSIPTLAGCCASLQMCLDSACELVKLTYSAFADIPKDQFNWEQRPGAS